MVGLQRVQCMGFTGDLVSYEIRRHGKGSARTGARIMQAVSWFDHGGLGEVPSCSCPVVAACCSVMGDTLDHGARQDLLGYIPAISSSMDGEAWRWRADMAIRVAATGLLPIGLESLDRLPDARLLSCHDGTLASLVAQATAQSRSMGLSSVWAPAASWSCLPASRMTMEGARRATYAAWAASVGIWHYGRLPTALASRCAKTMFGALNELLWPSSMSRRSCVGR